MCVACPAAQTTHFMKDFSFNIWLYQPTCVCVCVYCGLWGTENLNIHLIDFERVVGKIRCFVRFNLIL